MRDTGVGMTEEEIAIALTPFGQVDGSRARWREGTGLGLPIAKALVELHGGELEIRSTKDRRHRGHGLPALAASAFRHVDGTMRRGSSEATAVGI